LPERAPTGTGLAEFNSRLRFLGAFVREPLTIGAVWPSSSALARKVVESCEITLGDTIVELGPGTGVFTELILQRLGSHGRFVAVEIHPSNVHLCDIDSRARDCA
jgi:phospholipid N-methyltransferase